jgi:hypothetical protein
VGVGEVLLNRIVGNPRVGQWSVLDVAGRRDFAG